MRIGIMMIVLIFTALAFSSCKDQDSKETLLETKTIETEQPASAEPENEEEAKLLDRIENYILRDYLTERDLRIISKNERKFQFHKIDLNNDGKDELFINFVTPYFCGTGGCSILLLNDQLELITEFTGIITPIYIEETVENGWRVLMVQSEGKWRNLIYEDGSYPSNPSFAEISNVPPSKTSEILFDATNGNLKTNTF